MLIDPRGGFFESRADRDRRTLHADDAGAFEHAPFVGAQTIDLSLDELPDVFRNAGLDVGERPSSSHSCPTLDDDALGEQVLDKIHHEQRIAFGAAVNEPRQPLRADGGRAT